MIPSGVIWYIPFGKRLKKRVAQGYGKLMMPFAVQAHHSFVDGLHIGRFAELMQRELDGYLN